MSQTITKASGSITSPRAVQVIKTIGADRINATILNKRVNGQPDFAPSATVARAIVDQNDQVVADSNNLHPDAKGVVALASGTQDFIITGLALGFTPIGGTLVVVKNAAGDTDLQVSFVGVPTADGFTGRLSAATGNANYKIAFSLF